uniref:Uncharacterized protein n=1 Tax=Anguilla anguilla TaxID=7936 RepID=A0A0E9WDC6_ANGAN
MSLESWFPAGQNSVAKTLKVPRTIRTPYQTGSDYRLLPTILA